ncbi:hypothetical protein ABZ671_00875 [Micromonospora sp. NPDC006766]|uniref:hypothetical protein n=1 Tax=Micromonospora sp. NPDC006766 TaxID=3154778 RepID=UPI0033EAFA0F
MADEFDDEGFDLDAAWAEEEREPFKFRWRGVWWVVPHLGDLDWRASSLADEMDVDAIRELFDLALPDERKEEWNRVKQPAPAMVRLFKEWTMHSGEEPGETQGSVDSSPSTGPASKRTSTATTKSGSAKPSSARRKTGTPRGNS